MKVRDKHGERTKTRKGREQGKDRDKVRTRTGKDEDKVRTRTG